MRRLIIIGFLLWIGTLLLLSCNAVKRVNKDTDKQLEVIKEYSKRHPSKNDTVTVVIPGKPEIRETTLFDTVDRFVTANCPPERTIYKDRLKTTILHDTIKTTIVDRKMERAYQDAAYKSEMDYGKNLNIVQAKADDFKDKRDIWRKRFYILLAASVVAVFLAIKLF